MTLTTQHLTLSEYLNQIKGTDLSYELVKGELTPMALGTGRHGEIGKRLVQIFDRESDRANNEWTALQRIVGVQSPKRERWDTVRIPDVVIIPKSQWKQLQNQ
ncbi:MAG: hypothetical protein GVY17_06810 [Cyanobacteria bacterium]|jgi:Uma2 family endonuclease|nr:hypothetical protein [Cyanobacteria bacterium GSL.Bin21]